MSNIDQTVVKDFGTEWTRFNQSNLDEDEQRAIFDAYFAVFPWEELPENAVGADIGCGSGRWAQLAAARVGRLHCVEPSDAIYVARENLQNLSNVEFHHVDVDHLPFADESLDFIYSLGVLHHIPNTSEALKQSVKKLKKGGFALIYLYYRFDNRPMWFQGVWRASDAVRKVTSQLPAPAKHRVADLLAATVYWPLTRIAKAADLAGLDSSNIPLSSYRDKSFYTMRTDALDRFGTRLEQRFTRSEIQEMMRSAGLTDICFSDDLPFWCACGVKA